MGGIFLWWWSRAGEIGHASKATHGQSPCHLSGRAFTLKEEVPVVQKVSRGILRRQGQVQRPWAASANPCFVVKEVVIVTDGDSYPPPKSLLRARLCLLLFIVSFKDAEGATLCTRPSWVLWVF